MYYVNPGIKILTGSWVSEESPDERERAPYMTLCASGINPSLSINQCFIAYPSAIFRPYFFPSCFSAPLSPSPHTAGKKVYIWSLPPSLPTLEVCLYIFRSRSITRVHALFAVYSLYPPWCFCVSFFGLGSVGLPSILGYFTCARIWPVSGWARPAARS